MCAQRRRRLARTDCDSHPRVSLHRNEEGKHLIHQYGQVRNKGYRRPRDFCHIFRLAEDSFEDGLIWILKGTL